MLALRVSDRRIQDADDSLRFFDEGLAEHQAWRLVPNSAGLEARWLEALLAHRRLRVAGSDLFGFAAFRAKFGEATLYPVAMSWVAALCSTCGDQAPARVLRALAEPGATADVAGKALWLRTLQAIGCDLSRVELQWAESLREKSAAFQSELDRVPDLAAGISLADEEMILLRAEATGKPLEDSTYQLNTRASADAAHAETMTFSGERQADGSVHFLVTTELVDPEILHYQLVQSWIRNGAVVRHAQKWQQARIPARR